VDADWSRLSDDELLRRARREPDAFAAFYSRHERLTLAFFIGGVGDAEVAADLAAETFAAALTAVPRFRRRQEPATAWLLGMHATCLAREAVKARGVDERDYADIARDLRCSEAVVRKRVSRGLTALCDEVEETT
jgi:DNA-directed RNA polymerase specialized sigma24 family protein